MANTLAPPSEPDDRPVLEGARLASNRGRLFRLMPPLLGLNILHLLVFAFGDVGSGSRESEQWRTLIEISHGTMGAFGLAALVFLWRVPAGQPAWAWPVITSFYLVTSAWVAGVDQLVTHAVTPFLVACFGLALVIRLDWREATACYALAFVAFLAAVWWPLPPSEVRTSLAVNGTMVAGLGLAMSITFTRAFMQAEASRIIISRQKGELESLRGVLAVCSYCRKIRNEKREWEALDLYIARTSDTRFSHGICEACFERVNHELDQEEAMRHTHRTPR